MQAVPVAPHSTISPPADGRPGRYYRATVLVLIGLGLVLRAFVAAATHLAPGEALNLLSMNQPAAADLFAGSAGVQQPVYLWLVRLAGGPRLSDLLLRLPAVIAGTAALWFAHRWLLSAFGRRAALAGLLVMALAPVAVIQSAAVQGFVFVPLFAAAALWLLERGRRENSPAVLLLSGLALCLAVAAHVSGTWFAVGFGVYAGMLLARPGAGRLVRTWVAGQATALVLAMVLYLRPGVYPVLGLLDEPAFGARFVLGQDGVLEFIARRTAGWFASAFGGAVAGWPALAAFLAGAGILVARWLRGARSDRDRLARAISAAAPFVVAWLAAIFRLSAFGAGSTMAWLVVFAAAGIGVLAAAAGERHYRPALAVAGLLLVLGNLGPGGVVTRLRHCSRAGVVRAAAHARDKTGAPVLADGRTQLLLWRYLPGSFDVTADSSYLVCRAGPSTVVSPRQRWAFSADSLNADLSQFTDAFGVPGGTRATVVSGRRGERLDLELASRLDVRYDGALVFGHFVALPVPVTDDRVIARVARAGAARSAGFRTVLWPAPMLSDSAIEVGSELAPAVVSYRMLLGSIGRRGARKLYERLPALALWRVGVPEPMPDYLRAMDGLADTVVGPWQLELLARDSAGTTAAFRVSSPAGAVIDSLVRLAVENVGEPARTALLPDEFVTPGVRMLAGDAAEGVLMYSEFHQSMRREGVRLADFLPVLAFWRFGDPAWHDPVMRQMDSAADFRSGSYRFTLLAMDPDTVAGVYLIQLR